MEIEITSKNRWLSIGWKELARFRDLFYFLAWRDIKVRYKQTAIGVLWAFFVPFVSMVVFTVFFGNFVKLDTNGIPYPIFVFIGLLFWTFFSQAITSASNSLVGSQDIVKKIYFPRVLLPAASIFVSLIDFAVAAGILALLMVYYRFVPDPVSLLVLPILILVALFAVLGLGLLLAALNVRFRDVRFLVTFFLQMMLFVTPVIYPTTIIGPQWRWILFLNPMAGVIEASRAVLLNRAIPWEGVLMSIVVSVVVGLVGFFYFQKTEKTFADII